MIVIAKKIFIVLAIFFLLILVVGVGTIFYFRWAINKPFANNQVKNIVEIKAGATPREIAADLFGRGQIRSEFLFLVLARLDGSSLQAGVYRISPNASLFNVYDLISSGEATHTKVTIPEGYRLEQIAQVLAEKELVSYPKFLEVAEKVEGKLFPDTYFIPLGSKDEDIAKMMQNNYDERTKGLAVAAEDLIVASIVEREAVRDEERALIAGVFKNRLAKGMKLEADPTLQYARDIQDITKLSASKEVKYKFWQSITLKEHAGIDSPYNTYLYAGLPPGPICNPGLASIKATVDYDKHDYLYFLHKDGEIYPSKTEAEHNQTKARVLGVRTKS